MPLCVSLTAAKLLCTGPDSGDPPTNAGGTDSGDPPANAGGTDSGAMTEHDRQFSEIVGRTIPAFRELLLSAKYSKSD